MGLKRTEVRIVVVMGLKDIVWDYGFTREVLFS
jgi:hypothetical protein